MNYTTINIQGNLISEEILQKIENSEATGQQAVDFGFEPNSNLRSEVEYAWSRIRLDWKHFSDKLHELPASDPYGTTLSRRWMEQFLSSLGFTLTRQRSSLIGENGQSYVISHTVDNLDDMPVHIVGFNEPDRPDKNTLDIKTSGGTSRMSPHATMQEYLNVTEHLFGLATNGMMLRLIRDSGRLIKLTYLEFDIKRMLDEDKYSEFTLLYRLLHASRFPHSKTEGDQSLLEQYYQNSIESGNRIREGLSEAVKESLVALGTGLLNHPDNDSLREAHENGSLTAFNLNHQLLRLIYRLLFLIVTEERDLIFDNGSNNPEQIQNKEIYYKYYSLERLRKLSASRYLYESRYSDLWQGLIKTFSFFEPGNKGLPLGIYPLGGELFSESAISNIRKSMLSNRVLLECIRNLNEFEDEQKNRVLINYRSLDVEELGSIYEGLLELSPVIISEGNNYRFSYEKGSERSSSGSHYTPEDLVKSLIEHSLEYLIEDRVQPFYKGKADAKSTIDSLLQLKVCDVACGSGHILLSAARRIAHEVARIETGEQQPNPQSFRRALKDVISHCIYGVDKNPLAVELCKVALWLESHNPGEPLNFLDHHIKCGDAIVGLVHRSKLENGIPDEAFKTLPGDDKAVAKAFRDRNRDERKQRKAKEMQLKAQFEKTTESSVQEAMSEYKAFNQMPETTPEEIERKAKAYNRFMDGKGFSFLKSMADIQVAQFFIPKDEQNKNYLMTDAEYRLILSGYQGWQLPKTAMSSVVAERERFFHWFLEFPEVFNNGGFDCILANPPFLGDKKLKGAFGTRFLENIKYYFEPIGICDLVTYFFRRTFQIVKINGFISLISTNTISQGDARKGSLDYIVTNNGEIIYANPLVRWPGKAAVFVSLITITKGKWKNNKYINNKIVTGISTLLHEGITYEIPYKIHQNSNKSFIGNFLSGLGFVLNIEEAQELLKNLNNKDVIFPFLNGEDLNSNPNLSASRYVINFFDWPLNEENDIENSKGKISNLKGQPYASDYKECLDIVEKRVKPERKLKKDKSSRQKWWLHARSRIELYSKISNYDKVLVVARTSKTLAFVFAPKQIFSDSLVVFSLNNKISFSILQSVIHESWAWKYCTTMKTDLVYTPSNTFETYPFPQIISSIHEAKLEQIGEAYHEHRKQLMLGMQLGLTKTYNAFHCEEINRDNEKWSALLEELDNGKELSKIKLKTYDFEKESTNLIRHFLKGEATISLRNAVEGIEKLRTLHVEMDEAVLDTYGWSENSNAISEKPIKLRHGFYEVDYLPENDRARFTIHPEARKEVLKRLLLLNHKLYKEEVETGLWDKKKSAKPKKYKTNKKSNKLNEPEEGYGGLFD